MGEYRRLPEDEPVSAAGDTSIDHQPINFRYFPLEFRHCVPFQRS